MTASSAYIHIPFCAHKCDFCDFAAFAGVDNLSADYARVVKAEIHERVEGYTGVPPLESVFYGGGTPGYVAPGELSVIHEQLRASPGVAATAEVTIETTPHAITTEKVHCWMNMGINRISIGVESLHDRELQAMGRDHTREQALEGIRKARAAGCANIAVDLMYGLPEQTLESWEKTLDALLAEKPDHLSAYGLTIASRSPLLSRYPLDSPAYPGEETFVRMYEALVARCAAAGLAQYEISNFARPGFESRHNLNYWQNREYLAFGVSAHRYVDGIRSSNFRALARYMRDYMSCETSEVIDPETRIKEAIFLGLRMSAGLSTNEFCRRYGVDLMERIGERARALSAEGLLDITDDRVCLTQRGILISNSVMAELI